MSALLPQLTTELTIKLDCTHIQETIELNLLSIVPAVMETEKFRVITCLNAIWGGL